MSHTVYSNGTVVQPAWLNDVDTVTYFGGTQTGTGTNNRTPQSKLQDIKNINDFTSLSAAFTNLGGTEGTGYSTQPYILDLLGTTITLTADTYVPINISLINGIITSNTYKLIFRNPYNANPGLRSYTLYWPYMRSVNQNITFDCLTIINNYIGLVFKNCYFDQTNSALVLVNSNSLWTEYTTFDQSSFASNTVKGFGILFDGNLSGTSVYSTGTGAGTSTGSFGYTVFSPDCRTDSTAPAVGIKVMDGGTLYNSKLNFRGYSRGAGPSGAFLFIDSTLNISSVNSTYFNVSLESFGAASNVLSVNSNSRFWYNTGTIQSASPQMVMAQDGTADIRSNNVNVIGVALQDSNGSTITNGDTYPSTIFTNLNKRVSQVLRPAVLAYPNPAQSFTSGTTVTVNLTGNDFDTNSYISGNTYAPKVAGYYQVNAYVTFTGTAALTGGVVYIYKNGSQYRLGNSGATGSTMIRSTSGLIFLNGTTDYLEMKATATDSGGNPVISTGGANTGFSAVLVRTQ